MLYTQKWVSASCFNIKICLEPRFRLLPWQSGSLSTNLLSSSIWQEPETHFSVYVLSAVIEQTTNYVILILNMKYKKLLERSASGIMVAQLRDSPKPPIHHCTMILRGPTGFPIWPDNVKKHMPLGQQSKLFQSVKIQSF